MRFPGKNYPIDTDHISVTNRLEAMSALDRVFHHPEIAYAALLLVLFHQRRGMWGTFTVEELDQSANELGIMWDECQGGFNSLCIRKLVSRDKNGGCRVTHEFIAKVFEACPRGNVVT